MAAAAGSGDQPSPLSHIYNTTFTLHKLTPLSLPANIPLASPATLKSHSTRLTNLIRGEILRGVRIAEAVDEESSTSRTGNLKKVVFDSIRVPTARSSRRDHVNNDNEDEEEDAEAPGGLKAVAIIFYYERITYSAYLLQPKSSSPTPAAAATATTGRGSSRRTSLRGASAAAGATTNANYYPLLLTRLPAWLSNRFTTYLSEVFDCHVSILRMPPGFIMTSLEGYLEAYMPGEGVLDVTTPNKNVQLWLEPPLLPGDSAGAQKEKQAGTGPGRGKRKLDEMKFSDEADGPEEKGKVKMQSLKSVLMNFTREDVPGMLWKGKGIRERLDDEKDEEMGEGNAEQTSDAKGPFELALSLYTHSHMGILLDKMRIGKVACGEFVLGTGADGGGRAKMFEPRRRRAEDGGEWDGLLKKLVDLAA